MCMEYPCIYFEKNTQAFNNWKWCGIKEDSL